jgi:hypothetical protein
MRRGDRQRIPRDESRKTRLFARGTEGSNPSPSSGESCANLMMGDIELARPHEKIIALLGDGSSMYA